jgi:ABC-type uncharacterized transport system auxiliary subunit
MRIALGDVRGGSYLRDRIMYRQSGSELGFYEEHRWVDQPASYLRRALARELFDRHGVAPVLTGPGATLEVQLVSFEEVRAPRRVAHFEAVYFLYGGGLDGVERSVVLEQAIPQTDDPIEGVVQALGQAVALGARRIANDVVSELQAQASSDAPNQAASNERIDPFQSEPATASNNDRVSNE